MTLTQSSRLRRWELGLSRSPSGVQRAVENRPLTGCQPCGAPAHRPAGPGKPLLARAITDGFPLEGDYCRKWWWGGCFQTPLFSSRWPPERGPLLFTGRRPQGQWKGVGGLLQSGIDSRCSAGVCREQPLSARLPPWGACDKRRGREHRPPASSVP